MAAEGELEVQILEQRELSLPAAEGEPRVEVWITYRHGTLPPGLIRLPKAEATEEKIKAAIKADIQARIAQKPKTLKV